MDNKNIKTTEVTRTEREVETDLVKSVLIQS